MTALQVVRCCPAQRICRIGRKETAMTNTTPELADVLDGLAQIDSPEVRAAERLLRALYTENESLKAERDQMLADLFAEGAAAYTNVTRFEVIDHRSEDGRRCLIIGPDRSLSVRPMLQDEGRTLKVFLNKTPHLPPRDKRK
jgi:hypothetical protein